MNGARNDLKAKTRKNQTDGLKTRSLRMERWSRVSKEGWRL
jgi:hypothetical protein